MPPIMNIPEEERATDIGNLHKKLVKIARVIPEISYRTDRQTHKRTHHNTSQYFCNKTLIGKTDPLNALCVSMMTFQIKAFLCISKVLSVCHHMG